MSAPNITDVQSRINRVVGLYARAHGESLGLISEVRDVSSGRHRNGLVRRMQTLVSSLGQSRDKQVSGLVRLAYARGLHLVDVEDRFNKQDEAKVSILQESLVERLVAAEKMTVRSFTDAMRRTQLVTSAMALQESQGTGGALATMLRPAGYLDKSGTRWGLLQYAEMALRTVTHEALSEATVTAMKNHNWDLIKVSGGSLSTSPSCQPYQGKTFSIVAGNPEYSMIDQLPPFHNGCEHFIYYAGLANGNN